MWRGVVWCGVAWRGAVRCGAVWCGVVGSDVVWCGEVWHEVVCCGTACVVEGVPAPLVAMLRVPQQPAPAPHVQLLPPATRWGLVGVGVGYW